MQTVARVNGQTYAFLAFVRLKGMPCLSCGHDKKEFTSLRMKHPKKKSERKDLDFDWSEWKCTVESFADEDKCSESVTECSR